MEEVTLTIEELKALFIRLTKAETDLSVTEQGLLIRIEKFLYKRLSIQEAETLMSLAMKYTKR
jgi:hypothetical protein